MKSDSLVSFSFQKAFSFSRGYFSRGLAVNFEEDTYSSIFLALKHPIRRRMLRILERSMMTYTEILNGLGVEKGLLNYHLESLRELVTKRPDDKYTLSEFGKAALSLIQRVEEPIKRNGNPKMLKNRAMMAIALLLIALVVLSGLYVNLYVDFEKQKMKIDEQDKDLENLRGIIDQTSYLNELRDLSLHSSASILSRYSLLYEYYGEAPFAETASIGNSFISFFSPKDNLTLHIYLITMPDTVFIPLTLQRGNAFFNSSISMIFKDEQNMTSWKLPVVWSVNTNKSNAYRVQLPSKGWYTLSLMGPVSITKGGGMEFYVPSGSRVEFVQARANFKLVDKNEEILFAVWRM